MYFGLHSNFFKIFILFPHEKVEIFIFSLSTRLALLFLRFLIISNIFLTDKDLPEETLKIPYIFLLNNEILIAFIAGIALSGPIYKKISSVISETMPSNRSLTFEVSKILFLFLILTLSILKVASSTYDPFIYFRF